MGKQHVIQRRSRNVLRKMQHILLRALPRQSPLGNRDGQVAGDIEQSPSFRQFVWMNQSFRNRKVEFVCDIGPADAFEPASPIERPFVISDLAQTEFVFRIFRAGIIPVFDLRKENIGISQVRFPNPDLRFDRLSALLFESKLRNDLFTA